MKKVTPYLPVLLIGVAVIIGFYFLYYRPKKQAAEQEAQEALDAANSALLDGSIGKKIDSSLVQPIKLSSSINLALFNS